MRIVMRYLTPRRLVALAATTLWGFLLYSGGMICLGAAEQGIKGLPSDSQLRLYVWTPLIFVLAEIIVVVAGRRIWRWLIVTFQIFAFVMLLLVSFLFGGEV